MVRWRLIVCGTTAPGEGGFDKDGKLTRVAGDIEISKRPLPIGYWKGSGIALMLDLVAGLLSAGSTTYQIPAEAERETRLSQVFIAFDPSRCGDSIDTSDLAEQVIRHFRFRLMGKALVFDTRASGSSKLAKIISRMVCPLSPQRGGGYLTSPLSFARNSHKFVVPLYRCMCPGVAYSG